jgi:hypothetical protein
LRTWHMTSASRLIGEFSIGSLAMTCGCGAVLGQASASRSDRCTAEDREANTYKVVGYLRLRVCILTGCGDNIR